MNNKLNFVAAFFLLIVISSSPLWAQMAPQGQAPTNPLLALDLDKLYNQDAVTSHPDFAQICIRSDIEKKPPNFQLICREYQQDLLEDHYLLLREEMLTKQRNTKVGMGLAAMGLQFLMYAVTTYLQATPAFVIWIQNSAIGVAATALLYNSMGEVNAAANISFDPFKDYEIAYVRIKPWLSKDLQRAIEDNFKAGRHAQAPGPYLEFARYATSFPLDSYLSKKALDVKSIENRLSKQSDPKTFAGIKSFFRAFRGRESEEEINTNRRISAYFYGKTRTGKSEAAKQIAKELGVPLEKIRVGGASISDLIGRPKLSSNPTPGLIVEAILKAKRADGRKSKNIIILLDEVDRLFNLGQAAEGKDNTKGDSDWLLSFLDLLDTNQTHKSFFSPYFGVDIDMSHVTFIMTGNNEIKDEALKARIQYMVEFKGYKKDYKREVLLTEWLPERLVAEQRKTGCQLTISDFYNESKLNSEAETAINKLIEEDSQPGFAALEWNFGQLFTTMGDEKCKDQF